jgi:flagellar basal-body rod protein FlgF
MSEIASQIGSAIEGLTREFNIITHNLANVSTDGYKRRTNNFSKTLTELGAGSKARIGDEADLYSTFDFTQGNFIESGRSMDFALVGKGFFVIETPDGPLYTRNGAFRVDQNGQIVDQEGRTIAGQNGPITIPPGTSDSEVSVSSDGSIKVKGLPIDQFQLVDFQENEKELVSVGLNCYLPTSNIEPEDAENTVVKQGYKEGSNVQMVEELVDMIMVSRLYESNMKFMTVGKDNSKSLMSVAMG